MIYLDNAATTFKKPINTIFSTIKALTKYSANPSRSSHKQSVLVGEMIEQCRNNIKTFVNAPVCAEVVYTYNCTEAINYAILGTLKSGDHAIITTFEHNAVIRTLHSLKTIGITYSEAKPNNLGIITINQIKKLVKPNTKLIIINNTSNVTGTTTKVNQIGKFCSENNILLLVDCAQSGGHEKIDMKNDNINFIALAGHKGLYGPQGIGALIINNTEPSPIKFGGSGSESINPNMPSYYPEKLEAGTINTVGILGLNAGINFVNNNFEKINSKIFKLSNHLIKFLKSNNNFILYSNNAKSGVISFNIKNKNTQEVINILNQNNICVRGGLHCAPLIHKHLNTLDGGTIRVSICYFNKLSEIKTLIKVLTKIVKNKA